MSAPMTNKYVGRLPEIPTEEGKNRPKTITDESVDDSTSCHDIRRVLDKTQEEIKES